MWTVIPNIEHISAHGNSIGTIYNKHPLEERKLIYIYQLNSC